MLWLNAANLSGVLKSMTAALRAPVLTPAPLGNGLPAAYGAAALTVLIWGATPAATQLAVDGIDPISAGVLRTVLAALIAIPLAVYFGMPLPRGRRQWALLIISATGVFIGFPLLFSLGVKHTSVSHASLINAGIPIFTGLFGAIAEKRIPSRIWGLGVAVAFAGVGMLIGFRDEVGGDATLMGDLLCLASSASSGLGYVTGARLGLSIGSRSSAFWGLGFAGIVMAPLLYINWGATDWGAVSAVNIGAIFYMAIVSSIIAFIAWYWALGKGGIVRMAPLQFAMPVISLTLAVTVFGEQLTVFVLLSAAVIVSGIAIARKG